MKWRDHGSSSSSRGPASPFACELNPEALQNDLDGAHERAVPLPPMMSPIGGGDVDDKRPGIAAGGKDPSCADNLDDVGEQMQPVPSQGDVGMGIGNADRKPGSRAVFAYAAIEYGIHRAQLRYPDQRELRLDIGLLVEPGDGGIEQVGSSVRSERLEIGQDRERRCVVMPCRLDDCVAVLASPARARTWQADNRYQLSSPRFVTRQPSDPMSPSVWLIPAPKLTGRAWKPDIPMAMTSVATPLMIAGTRSPGTGCHAGFFA